MTNAELIKAIRENEECNKCAIWMHGECNERKMSIAAAAALEAADEKIADYTAAIDALDDSNDAYIKENERIKKRISELEAQLPKEGEWKWLSSTYDRVPREMRYWCSVCHHEEITHNDKPWKHYCPNCGAKMKGEQE